MSRTKRLRFFPPLAAAVLLAGFLGASTVRAEIAAVRWRVRVSWEADFYVYGMDLATGAVVWTFQRSREVNFAIAVKDGTLVGADDGTLTLLDTPTGKIKWEFKTIGKIRRINEYHGEFQTGYLVSDSDQRLFFVGLDGKLIWSRGIGEESHSESKLPPAR